MDQYIPNRVSYPTDSCFLNVVCFLLLRFAVWFSWNPCKTNKILSCISSQQAEAAMKSALVSLSIKVKQRIIKLSYTDGDVSAAEAEHRPSKTFRYCFLSVINCHAMKITPVVAKLGFQLEEKLSHKGGQMLFSLHYTRLQAVLKWNSSKIGLKGSGSRGGGRLLWFHKEVGL